MSLEFLNEFGVPVIVGVCLCVGYILKHLVPTEKIDRFIPLIMGALGVALNLWIRRSVSPDILLGGLFSGLASTGLHQAFKQLIDRKEKNQ